ncbi:MAG: adenosylcobinamide-GDP ribazoletransferase [Clostridiaceae bacterium]|jgi:adenosylcobinamide-GDP ribazoletransferase|nr:adenosylcobinamide-GDP ribazoletransferase [Clostridiaceae bacterium]
MKKYFQSFLLMLQFFTRIPLNINLPCEMEDFRRGAAYFSLIGFIIGGIQLLIYVLLIRFLNYNIISILVVLSAVLITGGLHLDGLGDTCDGFFALKGSDKIIEIMKDSRIGTFACAAIVFDILIKVSAYNNLIMKSGFLSILVIPILGRLSIAFLSAMGNPAKPKGSGNLFIKNIGFIQILINIIICMIICIPIIGSTKTLTVILVSGLITFLFNKFCIHKMGGITGDSFGANNELVEIVILIILSSM